MPFGIHKDEELTDVPKPYLRWLRGQPWLGGWLFKEIDLVMKGEVVADTDESFEEALKILKEEENDPRHA